MPYRYSICHPDRADIEYPDVLLSAGDVRSIVENYPWKAKLQQLKTLRYDEIHFNPSLDFTDLDNQYSFCLTAEGDPDDYSFSVWFNRPRKKKVLFGLLGETEKFEVIDKWFSKDDAWKLLDMFLMKAYPAIEHQMTNQ